MKKITTLRTAETSFEQQFEALMQRHVKVDADVERIVKTVLQRVKDEGDSALFEFTERYDQLTIDKHSVQVPAVEVTDAYQRVDPTVVGDLHLAAQRIERFHHRQLKPLLHRDVHDTTVTEAIRPLCRVGLYIPGGKAAYPSSVLMCAIPARVAGVRDIIMVSPQLTPPVLAAAHIAGVSCIYRIGGAQAVAALAYGTETVPRVDKIVGPGNVYVETAKRLVFGIVGLDMVAGPSEVVIVADESALPSFAASDFIAQLAALFKNPISPFL